MKRLTDGSTPDEGDGSRGRVGSAQTVILLILQRPPSRATMPLRSTSVRRKGPETTEMPASARRVDFPDGYQVRLRAALNGGDGRLMTLSEGGAYIATPLALLPQAQLHVAIQIPELRRTVELEAVVAWENRGTTRPSPQPEGYGLRFIKIPTASGEAIRWLLRRQERSPKDPETTQGLSPADVQEAMERARDRFGPDAVAAQAPINPLTAPRRRPRALGDLTTRALVPLKAEHHELGDGLDEGEAEGPPYRLEAVVIHQQVAPSTAGVFVLSYDRTVDARIGRADTDLRLSLIEFLDRYAYFYFEAIASRKERFERECELFHRLGGDHGQLDNEEHPLPPPGPQLKCPVCVKSASGL